MRRLQIARRHLQFSLGTGLLATTAFSIWLGLQTDAADRQRTVVAEIRRLGGEVYYDWQIDENDVETHQAGPPGPGWLRHWIGDDYLRELYLLDTYLRELYLLDTALTRDGLTRLRKKLPNCDVLNGLDEWTQMSR